MLLQVLYIISKPLVNSNWSNSPETLNSAQNRHFGPARRWNLTDNLEKQQKTSSTLLQALYAISKPLVNSDWGCSPDTLNSGQNQQCLSHVTLKFDAWLWKTIGQLCNATPSLLHHFKSIWKFKQELQSGNTQFGSISTIFQPSDLGIWRINLNKNRAPLLTYFKRCAFFRTHWWLQTGVTVQKHLIWVKLGNILSPVTLQCDE